jgi:pyrroloquinoline quinone biosynthesis protein A
MMYQSLEYDSFNKLKDLLNELINQILLIFKITFRGNIMWTTPAATEMRFGFEVTMYVMNK